MLITSDVQIADPEIRAELVETLLQMFDRGDLAFTIFGPSYGLHRLAHPHLADQLRPWIRTAGESEGRVAALRVAAQCHVQELADDALAVALDEHEPEGVRVDALTAAGTLLPANRLELLRPFAFDQVGRDPDGRLKGFALQILFPAHLSLDETLTAMTPPSSGSLRGAYEHFLTHDFPEHVRDEDLASVLRWLMEGGGQMRGSYAVSHMTDALMRRAWIYIDRDDVRDALARVAWRRLKHDERLWRRPILDDDSPDPLDDTARRRRLLTGLVALVGDSQINIYNLLHGSTPPLRSEDVPWMVDQVVAGTPHAKVWASLIWHVANVDDAVMADHLLRTIERADIDAETDSPLADDGQMEIPPKHE